jgi:hypothetical protein
VYNLSQAFITSSSFSLLYFFQFISYILKLTGCSQVNFTNHPKGNQFKLNKVHFLSVKSFLALGGIPSQNSSTLTQNFLAAAKCHHSCISITIENIIIATIIQRIIIICLFIKISFKRF